MVKCRSGVPSAQLRLLPTWFDSFPKANGYIVLSSKAPCNKPTPSHCLLSPLSSRHIYNHFNTSSTSRSLSSSRMSDDEADPELLALLRAHILGQPSAEAEPETGVLEGAEYVYDNSIDVAVDMWSCKTAANAIYRQMQEKSYSAATWSQHELHPKTKDESTVAFIFTMDLLNFSFWSELPDDKRFAISYRGKTWTGYWSLVAALQRALDEGWSVGKGELVPMYRAKFIDSYFLPGIPITSSDFWQDENECTLETLRHVFRSTTDEEIPLLKERLACLREAGQVLYNVGVNSRCDHSLHLEDRVAAPCLPGCTPIPRANSSVLIEILLQLHQLHLRRQRLRRRARQLARRGFFLLPRRVPL